MNDPIPCLASMRAVAVLALAGALTACAVGPAYRRPAPPQVDAYTARPRATTIPAAPAAQGPIAAAQRLAAGAAVDREWWKGFGSASLDQLVAQALAHNPDLAATKATLQQARFNAKEAKGLFYPHVSLGLGAERSRTTGAAAGGFAGPQLYDLYTGEVSISYDPDVFGLNRLVVRDQKAQVDVARDQLAAARLTIEGNVVTTAFALAALDDEVVAMRKTVSDEQQIVDLARTRYRLGASSQLAVLTQASQLASSQARLTQLEQARDAARHVLTMYVGTFPAAAGGMKTPALAQLHLPTTLPVSLPATLVRERPDIRAAEAQLRAANARVGEAVAEMFPHLQLTGAFGRQSNHTGSLFDPASKLWDLAAGLVMPLFEGGTLRAQKHAAQAAYRGVFEQYRGTVLNAFREVADVLRALEHDSALLDAQATALATARQAFALVQTEYRAGGVDYLALLTSEVQYQNARIAFAQAQARRYADTAALYLAFGGGEWTDATMPHGAGATAPSAQQVTGAPAQ